MNTAEKTILMLISTSTAFPIAEAIKQITIPLIPDINNCISSVILNYFNVSYILKNNKLVYSILHFLLVLLVESISLIFQYGS